MSSLLKEYVPAKSIPFHATIRFHPKLTFGERAFLAELKSTKKLLPYSPKKLSDVFHVSQQCIHNWVKKLVKMNFIEIIADYKKNKDKLFIKVKE